MALSGESQEAGTSGQDDNAVKFALAISLLRSKLLQNHNQRPSDSDALRWKRKAMERKQELLRLREALDQAEDASQCDLFPLSASCKCYFFDRLGKVSPRTVMDGSDRRFNDVLRRRFLRQVRFKERKRKSSGSVQRRLISDLTNEDEVDQLRASVDYLVELCDTVSPVEEVNFANWSHQAVDFILASLKSVLSVTKNVEVTEGIVCSLITRLVKKMCSPIQGNGSDKSNTNNQFHVQHMVRKLGNEPFIGQRAIISISQNIYVLGESLLFTDPFDVAFPHLNDCMFIMYNLKELPHPYLVSTSRRNPIFVCVDRRIQLLEFLISDYLSMWSKHEGFEKMLFEEWVTSIFHTRKALELLESRNGLFVLYMDRVTGELAIQVGQVSSLQEIKPEILDKLLC